MVFCCTLSECKLWQVCRSYLLAHRTICIMQLNGLKPSFAKHMNHDKLSGFDTGQKKSIGRADQVFEGVRGLMSFYGQLHRSRHSVSTT